jgi:hypothetical protein
VKASLLGASVTIPITDGRFHLGTWQGVWLCEHRDHPCTSLTPSLAFSHVAMRHDLADNPPHVIVVLRQPRETSW